MRILLWHVHGSWTTAFVQGDHDYVVPVQPSRGPLGRGRAQTWTWPDGVVERTPGQLRDEPLDVVIVQRPCEVPLVEAWTGRRAGRDLPVVWLEHDAPQGRIDDLHHPSEGLAGCGALVHVTHFNAAYWDAPGVPTRVVEHGIVDPGPRYDGQLERAAAVVNEPVRRRRVAGIDLLERLAVPVDLFGMGAPEAAGGLPAGSSGIDDTPQDRLHDELAGRRVYVHPYRWTSLGLSLVEAMHLGMPVVVFAATEAPDVVTDEVGVLSTRVDLLAAGAWRLLRDPDEARRRGKAARELALERFGLARFLAEWDEVLSEVVP